MANKNNKTKLKNKNGTRRSIEDENKKIVLYSSIYSSLAIDVIRLNAVVYYIYDFLLFLFLFFILKKECSFKIIFN